MSDLNHQSASDNVLLIMNECAIEGMCIKLYLEKTCLGFRTRFNMTHSSERQNLTGCLKILIRKTRGIIYAVNNKGTLNCTNV